MFRNKDLGDFLGLVGVRSGVKRVKPLFGGRISLFKERRDYLGPGVGRLLGDGHTSALTYRSSPLSAMDD